MPSRCDTGGAAPTLTTIRWAVEHGVESIVTDNTDANRAMLAINERLGYQPLLMRTRRSSVLRERR